MSTTTRHDALQRLTKASADVRTAHAQLREEQDAAWRRYVAVVEEALAADLASSASTVDAGEPTPDPVRELIDVIHGRIDDLRVRAHLGLMEAEELAEALRRSADEVVGHLRP